MRRMRRAKNHFNGSFFYNREAEGPPEVKGEETDFPVLLMLRSADNLPRTLVPVVLLFYFILFVSINIY